MSEIDMPTPLDLLRLRTRRLNKKAPAPNRDYILCWLQQALRAQDNPIIEVAIAAGNEHNLPVVVYHGLDNRYPYASHRLHRFILEASQSLGKDVKNRGLRFCRYVRRPQKLLEGLVYQLCERASMLITDDMPTYVAKWQAERVAKRVDIPVLVVDASCLVPMNSFTKLYSITKAFRAVHRPQRAQHIAVTLTQDVQHPTYEKELVFESDEIELFDTQQLDSLIAECHVDMSLPPAPFHGGRETAVSQLDHTIENVLPAYNFRRNNPADNNSTYKLSPYMHFGVLSAREVVERVHESDAHSAAKWKFSDELLTWREFYHHLARYEDEPTAFANVPQWAQETLRDHAHDPRTTIYSEDQLLHAETDDETWNAAQKQFLLDGWMHNNLRMYWVKQFLKWRPNPLDAWEMACRFNDRLSLDGRDPATYGSIQWGFGRSKKSYKEKPIYGWVPAKTDRALRKRTGAKEWLTQQANRPISFRVYLEAEAT